MKQIIMPRGGGKTTALIRLAAESNGYIVCRSMRDARRISDMAAKLGINIRFPLTYLDILERPGPSCADHSKIPLLLDNLEDFLLVIGNITAYSTTPTELVIRKPRDIGKYLDGVWADE